MNEYIVYFDDDYDEYGLEMFNCEQDALDFIEKRIQQKNNLRNYTLIKGEVLKLKAVETITKVKSYRG